MITSDHDISNSILMYLIEQKIMERSRSLDKKYGDLKNFRVPVKDELLSNTLSFLQLFFSY